MKFAKITFWVAAIWGFVVIVPLYFMFDAIGRMDPPPITHPTFYYGFVGTALAWQLAFLIIARDPQRFRPLIPACVLEKGAFVTAVIVMVMQGRTRPSDLVLAVTDGTLGVLFIVSYLKLRPYTN